MTVAVTPVMMRNVVILVTHQKEYVSDKFTIIMLSMEKLLSLQKDNVETIFSSNHRYCHNQSNLYIASWLLNNVLSLCRGGSRLNLRALLVINHPLMLLWTQVHKTS